MEIILNPYASTLIFSSLLVAGLSIYIGLKVDDSVKWIGFIMGSFSVWGFFYGIELTSQTVEAMLIWSKWQYIGLVLAPSCWVVFALKYTDYDTAKKPWIYPSIFVLPVITYLIVLTNDWHHLHYRSNWLNTTGPIPILGIEKGVWYPVQVVYSYFFYFLGTFILWRRFRFANIHFKLQTRLLIVGGFFPLAINLLYQISWVKPFGGLDLTPYAFLLTYIFIAVAIIWFNLLNLKPVARDKILEVMTRGVLVFDHRHKIIDFNSAAMALFTHPEEIKIGQTLSRLFASRPEIEKLILSKENKTIESRYTIENKERVFRVEAIQISDWKTMVVGVLVLIDDITYQIETNEQLKKQADELQQVNNMKDRLFSIISHDLKGPVSGVKELIHLTQNGIITEEEFLEMLPEVSKNMENVAILLENLLAWTGSQLRGEYIQALNLDLKKIVMEQKNLLRRIANEKSIEIDLGGSENTWIFADKNIVELILRNLLSNAIKFSRPRSKVSVTWETMEDKIKLSVTDIGIGIPQENLKRLNDGISITTRGQANETGTGLGLLLVREYITKSGGEMKIDSIEGRGTSICVTFLQGKNPLNFY